MSWRTKITRTSSGLDWGCTRMWIQYIGHACRNKGRIAKGFEKYGSVLNVD